MISVTQPTRYVTIYKGNIFENLHPIPNGFFNVLVDPKIQKIRNNEKTEKIIEETINEIDKLKFKLNKEHLIIIEIDDRYKNGRYTEDITTKIINNMIRKGYTLQNRIVVINNSKPDHKYSFLLVFGTKSIKLKNDVIIVNSEKELYKRIIEDFTEKYENIIILDDFMEEMINIANSTKRKLIIIDKK